MVFQYWVHSSLAILAMSLLIKDLDMLVLAEFIISGSAFLAPFLAAISASSFPGINV